MSHLRFFKRKCYVVIAYAPLNMTLNEADVAFNDFIADRSRGLFLFHDHFVARPPGAIALYYIDSKEHLEHLQDLRLLKEWKLQIFPLTFAELPLEFLYQVDFTMGVYGGIRLRDLVKEYAKSKYEKSLDERLRGRIEK
jgi:hypothetical protein